MFVFNGDTNNVPFFYKVIVNDDRVLSVAPLLALTLADRQTSQAYPTASSRGSRFFCSKRSTPACSLIQRGPGLAAQGGQHVGDAERLHRPVPGRKADGEVPTTFGSVRVPKDNEGVGPHRHPSRALHGVFGSIFRVLEAETDLGPTEGFFEGPSLAIPFDDLLRGQVEVGTGGHIVLLVTRPVADHDEEPLLVITDPVPNRFEDAELHGRWPTRDVEFEGLPRSAAVLGRDEFFTLDPRASHFLLGGRERASAYKAAPMIPRPWTSMFFGRFRTMVRLT